MQQLRHAKEASRIKRLLESNLGEFLRWLVAVPLFVALDPFGVPLLGLCAAMLWVASTLMVGVFLRSRLARLSERDTPDRDTIVSVRGELRYLVAVHDGEAFVSDSRCRTITVPVEEVFLPDPEDAVRVKEWLETSWDAKELDWYRRSELNMGPDDGPTPQEAIVEVFQNGDISRSVRRIEETRSL